MERLWTENLNDIKNKERREAIDKVKGAAKSVWNKFTGAVKKGAEAVKNKAPAKKKSSIKDTTKKKPEVKPSTVSSVNLFGGLFD